MWTAPKVSNNSINKKYLQKLWFLGYFRDTSAILQGNGINMNFEKFPAELQKFRARMNIPNVCAIVVKKNS